MGLIYPYTEYDRFCQSLSADSLKDIDKLRNQVQYVLLTTPDFQEMAVIARDGVPIVVVGETLDNIAELIAAQVALADEMMHAWAGDRHESSRLKFGDAHVTAALHADMLVVTLRMAPAKL